MNATATRIVRLKPLERTREDLEATPWARAFREAAPVSYKQAIQLALEPNLRVFLKHTDENGEPQWAICADDEQEFWMDAVDTRAQAVALCKTMRWKVVSA